jgi:hypothetical protein
MQGVSSRCQTDAPDQLPSAVKDLLVNRLDKTVFLVPTGAL